MHAWCLWRPEKDIRFLGSGVIDGDEPSCGCWEPTKALSKSSKCSEPQSISPDLDFLIFLRKELFLSKQFSSRFGEAAELC